MSIQRCVLIAVGITVGGCAFFQPNESKGWEAYQSFEQQLENQNDTDSLSPHLSQRILSLLEQASSDVEKRRFTTEVSYPLWVVQENAHFEKSTDSGDICLTVNGLAPGGGPASVSVRYIQEGGRIKAEEIHYELMETDSQYPVEARCPSEFSLEYPVVDRN